MVFLREEWSDRTHVVDGRKYESQQTNPKAFSPGEYLDCALLQKEAMTLGTLWQHLLIDLSVAETQHYILK